MGALWTDTLGERHSLRSKLFRLVSEQKKPWKGIFGFDRGKNETTNKKCLVPHSLLLNRPETLVTQAISDTSLAA